MFRALLPSRLLLALVAALAVLLLSASLAYAQPPFRLGIEVTPHSTGGLVIDVVEPGSYAEGMELKPGDRLLFIGLSMINSEDEMGAALDKAVLDGKLAMVVAKKSGGLVLITGKLTHTTIWPPELSKYIVEDMRIMPVTGKIFK